MQAFPNDRYYPQSGPPGYGQTPQYYQQPFPGYGYPQNGGPAGQPIAAPFPVYPNMQPGTPAPGRPRPLDRELSRASTPGRGGMKPLKSALKRTQTPDYGVPPGEIPPQLVRGRSQDTIHRQRTRSGSRMRSNSMPRFMPSHLILTLRSTNELHLENVLSSSVVGQLASEVLPIWSQGINRQEHTRGKWKVEFAGSPWASTGLDAIFAARMISRLYHSLGCAGYSYLSTVNVGSRWKPAQYIFAESTPDEGFVFLMTLSKSGDRLTILDAPPQLTEQLGIALRANFPRKITTDRATDDGLHVFEVRKGSYGVEVEKSLLIAYVLRFFAENRFKLCGSVPMGSRGLFNLGQRREMWVFKFRPPTRPKDFGRRPSSRQSRQEPGSMEE